MWIGFRVAVELLAAWRMIIQHTIADATLNQTTTNQKVCFKVSRVTVEWMIMTLYKRSADFYWEVQTIIEQFRLDL